MHRHRQLRSRARVVIAGAGLSAVLLTAGCGSSTASSASGTKSTSATTAAGGSGGGGAASGSGSGASQKVDVCSVLPVATVAQITGQPLSKASPDQSASVTAQYGIYNCNYTSADGASGVDVTVTTKNGKIAYDANYQASSSVKAAGATKIPGLGDEAYYAVDGVHARFGDVEISISGLDIAAAATGVGSNDSVATAKTLVTTIHDKL